MAISDEQMVDFKHRLEELRPLELTPEQGRQHHDMTTELLRSFEAKRLQRLPERD